MNECNDVSQVENRAFICWSKTNSKRPDAFVLTEAMKQHKIALLAPTSSQLLNRRGLRAHNSMSVSVTTPRAERGLPEPLQLGCYLGDSIVPVLAHCFRLQWATQQSVCDESSREAGGS